MVSCSHQSGVALLASTRGSWVCCTSLLVIFLLKNSSAGMFSCAESHAGSGAEDTPGTSSHQQTCYHNTYRFIHIPDTDPYWGWVTHICVSKLTIIASDNDLPPDQHQAIIWTNARILLLEPWEQSRQGYLHLNLYIFIQGNAFVVWKMAAILSWPECVNCNFSSKHDNGWITVSLLGPDITDYNIAILHPDISWYKLPCQRKPQFTKQNISSKLHIM